MLKYRLSFLVFFSISFLVCKSQTSVSYISFAYDNKGNRTSRTIVLASTLKSSKIGEDDLPSKIDTSGISQPTEPKEESYYSDFLGESEMRLYPNPTKGKMVVYIANASTERKGRIYLYDLNGHLIKNLPIYQQNTNVDITNYSSGNYIMKVNFNNHSTEWKIIKN